MCRGMLGNPGVLLSYSIIKTSLHITIILILTIPYLHLWNLNLALNQLINWSTDTLINWYTDQLINWYTDIHRYLTTPVKAIKRFSVSAKSSGFVNNGLAGAGNGNSSGSDSIGGGYGTVSPVNTTPRTPKGNFNRGPQSTPKIPRTPKESADHQQKLSDQVGPEV